MIRTYDKHDRAVAAPPQEKNPVELLREAYSLMKPADAKALEKYVAALQVDAEAVYEVQERTEGELAWSNCQWGNDDACETKLWSVPHEDNLCDKHEACCGFTEARYDAPCELPCAAGSFRGLCDKHKQAQATKKSERKKRQKTKK